MNCFESHKLKAINYCDCGSSSLTADTLIGVIQKNVKKTAL